MAKCTMCDRTQSEHRTAEAEGNVHHKFTGPGGTLQGLDKEIPKKGALPTPQVVMGPPSDAVLRTILIEKGVITLEDVEKAERTLRATGVVRTHGYPGQ